MADNRTCHHRWPPNQLLTSCRRLFNNLDPSDLLPEDTTVTFRVSMTMPGNRSHVFDPTLIASILTVCPALGLGFSLPQLTNTRPTAGYSIDLLLAKGNPAQQTYKYGINGNDERRLKTSTMFGTSAPPTRISCRSTPLRHVGGTSFGNLQASLSETPARPHLLVGRRGCHSDKSQLAGGLWVDHPRLTGLNSTIGRAPAAFVLPTGQTLRGQLQIEHSARHGVRLWQAPGRAELFWGDVIEMCECQGGTPGA